MQSRGSTDSLSSHGGVVVLEKTATRFPKGHKQNVWFFRLAFMMPAMFSQKEENFLLQHLRVVISVK